MKTTETGRLFERRALDYLQSQGLKLIEQNFHSSFGEIDLIMTHGKVLVFVEVRYRQRRDYGGAEYSVTPRKQRRIAQTAQVFVKARKAGRMTCRFDVIAFAGSDINWIRSAFDSPI
jgi:putative endonuclease